MAMNVKINFRCSEDFENLLLSKMKQAGYSSYSAFIRDSVEGVSIKQRCKGIQELIKQVNKIGVNLNQISRYANENKELDLSVLQSIDAIYKELSLLILRFNNNDS